MSKPQRRPMEMHVAAVWAALGECKALSLWGWLLPQDILVLPELSSEDPSGISLNFILPFSPLCLLPHLASTRNLQTFICGEVMWPLGLQSVVTSLLLQHGECSCVCLQKPGEPKVWQGAGGCFISELSLLQPFVFCHFSFDCEQHCHSLALRHWLALNLNAAGLTASSPAAQNRAKILFSTSF